MIGSTALVEPAFANVPPYIETLGPEVAGIAELAGFAPDPEQRLALDAIFGMGPNNKVAALEAAIVACRQNIKTGLFKQCALGWLFVTDQRLIIWSAHEFSTAQEAHRDLAELLENCDPLRKRVKGISYGHGDEEIELLTGQRVKFKARTKTGGRGLSGDKIVLDEAFALRPLHMGSLFPTLSVRPDPQVVYGSSAGLEESDVLRGLRDRGRAGTDPSLIYFEWTDDLPGECEAPRCDHHPLTSIGCRMDDQRRWARANTQLGRRLTVKYVEAERRALPAGEFGRERLGWWDDPDTAGAVISEPAWASVLDPESRRASDVIVAVAVTPAQDAASIVIAGRRSDGLAHIEVVDARPDTGWVVERLEALSNKLRPAAIVLDGTGPAGSLLPSLAERGVDVTKASTSDYAVACGAFYDAVQNRQLRHRGDPRLDTAVRAGRKRPLSDRWAWGRKGSADITSLEASTLALWALPAHRTYDVLQSIAF